MSYFGMNMNLAMVVSTTIWLRVYPKT